MAARISAGQGTSYINMNRREVLQDGTLRGLPFLGRNPNHVLTGYTERSMLSV